MAFSLILHTRGVPIWTKLKGVFNLYYLYEDQTNWNKDQLYSVYRYVYRMIERRNTTYGSIDGNVRMEEIKSLDLTRMSQFTKICLLIAIRRNCADVLLEMENLGELPLVSPLTYPVLINGDDFMPIDENLYKYGIINGLRRNKIMANGFLNLKDFVENLQKLNEMIENLVQNGVKENDFVFEIRCIGGFAMLYHNIRNNGITEDMDSLIKIDEHVKKCIKIIAMKNNLPYDWINDEKNFTGMSSDQFTWELTNINLPRIKVYVCSVEDLLVTKIGLAENHFNGQEEHSERKYDIDYQDTVLILKRLGIEIGVSNPGYVTYRLKGMGIDIHSYPNVKKILICNENPLDNLIWGTVLKCEDTHNIQEFDRIMDELEMTAQDFLSIYKEENVSYFPFVYRYVKNLIQ